MQCLLDHNSALSKENLISGFPIRYDSYWPAQLQSLARVWNISNSSVYNISDNQTALM